MTVPFLCRSGARSLVGAPFFSSRSAKLAPLARVVLAAWLTPVAVSLGMALGVTPAQAQLGGGPVASPPQQTVVLDFAVTNGIDAVVGRKAADALAVELANSRSYTVIPREQVDAAVANRPGLTPPYNTSTQASLARAVGARSVFSGRVTAVQITPGRQARVTIDVRQLEGSTEDYINGTTVSEISEVKLQNTPSEVLVDEAINKAAVSAVRSLAQTFLPRGVVLNVSGDNLITLNIGTRNGVQAGQRYTLLRDIYNKATDITSRVKIGEVRVRSAEPDQATAVLSAGGGSGVTTGDYVRRIYEFSNVPVTAAGDGATTQTPVTSPPPSSSPGIVHKTKKGVLGLGGLLLAIAIFGVGGGGAGGDGSASPQDVTAYRSIPGNPSNGPTNTNYTNFTGNITVTWTSGASGINTQSSDIAGYFIYRGTGGPPSNNPGSLQGFVQGNTRVFTEDAPVATGRTVQIVTGSGPASPFNVQADDSTPGTPTNSIRLTSGDNAVNAVFNQNPALSGNQYFYAVQRVTVLEQINNGTGTGNGTGNNTGNNVNGVTLRLTLSNRSSSSGGVTALVGPQIVSTNGDLSDFQVTIVGNGSVNSMFPGATPVPTATPNGSNTVTPAQFRVPLYRSATEFEIQIGTRQKFKSGLFTTPIVVKPTSTNASGNFVLTVDRAISVPDFTSGQLFVRVGARNRNDEPGGRTPFVFGDFVSFQSDSNGVAALNRSFLSNKGANRQSDGVGLPGDTSRARSRAGGRSIGPSRGLTPR